MKLYCAICLFVVQGTAKEAVTILGGTAVCEDHMCYPHDGAVQAALAVRGKGIS